MLERIEKAFPTNRVGDGPKGVAKSGDSAKRKMVSLSNKIPKKHRTETHCSLCKKHGGAHTTHNTADCQKYESNGTPKKNFKGTKPNGPSRGPETARGGSSYAQLSTKIDKLEKSNRKMKRAIDKKKRKRRNSFDSDDSSSS